MLTIFYSVPLSTLWIFLYIAMTLMLAQGIGWIVAGLHVFVRDTIQALQILMFLWFWFTPVLYSLDRLPANIRVFAEFNPMAIIVTGYRNSLLHRAQPGRSYQLTGVVVGGSVRRAGGVLYFAVADRRGSSNVPLSYTGTVPDLFRTGREVVVEGTLRAGTFVAKPGTLSTKCPSKYAPAKTNAKT